MYWSRGIVYVFVFCERRNFCKTTRLVRIDFALRLSYTRCWRWQHDSSTKQTMTHRSCLRAGAEAATSCARQTKRFKSRNRPTTFPIYRLWAYWPCITSDAARKLKPWSWWSCALNVYKRSVSGELALPRQTRSIKCGLQHSAARYPCEGMPHLDSHFPLSHV